MTTIGGKNDLPDFSGVRSFVRPEDLAGLNEATERFEATLGAFNGAVGDAEKTVSLTMAWIGVGEKLLSLASVIVQKWPAKGEKPAQLAEGVSDLASKLGVLSSLCASLANTLPVTAA
jgi:hypothetical protein